MNKPTGDKRKFSKEIGNNIKEYRTIRGMTLRNVAEKTNFTTSYIGLIERGNTVPNSYTLKQIAKALNVPISALFGESDIGEALSTLSDPIFTKEENREYLELTKEMIIREVPIDKLKKAIVFASELEH